MLNNCDPNKSVLFCLLPNSNQTNFITNIFHLAFNAHNHEIRKRFHFNLKLCCLSCLPQQKKKEQIHVHNAILPKTTTTKCAVLFANFAVYHR